MSIELCEKNEHFLHSKTTILWDLIQCLTKGFVLKAMKSHSLHLRGRLDSTPLFCQFSSKSRMSPERGIFLGLLNLVNFLLLRDFFKTLSDKFSSIMLCCSTFGTSWFCSNIFGEIWVLVFENVSWLEKYVLSGTISSSTADSISELSSTFVESSSGTSKTFGRSWQSWSSPQIWTLSWALA